MTSRFPYRYPATPRVLSSRVRRGVRRGVPSALYAFTHTRLNHGVKPHEQDVPCRWLRNLLCAVRMQCHTLRFRAHAHARTHGRPQPRSTDKQEQQKFGRGLTRPTGIGDVELWRRQRWCCSQSHPSARRGGAVSREPPGLASRGAQPRARIGGANARRSVPAADPPPVRAAVSGACVQSKCELADVHATRSRQGGRGLPLPLCRRQVPRCLCTYPVPQGRRSRPCARRPTNTAPARRYRIAEIRMCGIDLGVLWGPLQGESLCLSVCLALALALCLFRERA